jgi:uncharacterized protein (DUF2267 family)
MQFTDRLAPSAAKTFAEALPADIREALLGYAKETEYPIESVLEMAITFFLDVDAAGFSDCRTETPGQLRSRLEILETVIQQHNISLPEL